MVKSVRFFLGLLIVSGTANARAGEVTIGLSWVDGSPRPGTCHKTTFRGPAQLTKEYETNQKSKLEAVDVAQVERLRSLVEVRVQVNTWGAAGQECARTAEAPKRIVFLAKGSTEPLLSIPLEAKETEMANLSGAKFTVFEASGSVPVDDMKKLIGKEYEFRLIYDSHGYIDKWKKEYAGKVLWQ